MMMRSLRRTDWFLVIGLAVLTLAVYAQVRSHEFINYDDPTYITENAEVQAGLTLAGVRWALTDLSSANWSPLTWISHMADVQFFGNDAGAHHLVSVAIHVVSTVLLFLLLASSTGDRWPSALVAFIFGLHPLHVESVAWAAERKDVLCALFWMLTMLAYVRHVRGPSPGRYLAIVAAFCLGLAAKSMIVTLPFALLLFDVWPLGRKIDRRVLLEKVPLLLITAGACVLAFVAQRHVGAVASLGLVPIGARVGNAFLSVVLYLRDFLWPDRLAVFYPFPLVRPLWPDLAAAIAVAAASAAAAWSWRRVPFVATGWFWYVGTLVPVIGLVQVGAQSRADRYTYLPLIGASIVVAWGLAAACRRWPRARLPIVAATLLACVGVTVLTARQVATWRNYETLYHHALDATGDNFVVYTNLGSALRHDGRKREAFEAFQNALRVMPDSPVALDNYGESLMQLGRPEEALKPIARSMELDPDFGTAYLNLGAALSQLNRFDEAETIFRSAVRRWPDNADARRSLGSTLVLLGRLDEAIEQLTESQRIKPDSVETRRVLDRARTLKRQAGK